MPVVDLLLLFGCWCDRAIPRRTKILLTIALVGCYGLIEIGCLAGLYLDFLLCGIMGCWDLRGRPVKS
jgi:hypothetical protein